MKQKKSWKKTLKFQIWSKKLIKIPNMRVTLRSMSPEQPPKHISINMLKTNKNWKKNKITLPKKLCILLPGRSNEPQSPFIKNLASLWKNHHAITQLFFRYIKHVFEVHGWCTMNDKFQKKNDNFTYYILSRFFPPIK